MLFKTEELKKQFYDNRLDSRIKVIAYYLEGLLKTEYNAELRITDVFRTQAEQDLIYADNPDYQVEKFRSVHQEWRGLDITVVGEVNSDKLLEHINSTFEYQAGSRTKTMLFHDVGFGKHGHLQVNSSTRTDMIKRLF